MTSIFDMSKSFDSSSLFVCLFFVYFLIRNSPFVWSLPLPLFVAVYCPTPAIARSPSGGYGDPTSSCGPGLPPIEFLNPSYFEHQSGQLDPTSTDLCGRSPNRARAPVGLQGYWNAPSPYYVSRFGMVT